MSGQVIVTDYFGNSVKELYPADFWIGRVGSIDGSGVPYATPTALKSRKCHIILFYDSVTLDPLLKEAWDGVSASISGPVIASVNCRNQREIMKAFFQTENDLDHPLGNFSIHLDDLPQILVYRGGWPQAYYNGELSELAITNWIATLACKVGYKEQKGTFRTIANSEAPIGYFPPGITSRDFIGLSNRPNGQEATRQYTDEELDMVEQALAANVGSISEQQQDIGYLNDTF